MGEDLADHKPRIAAYGILCPENRYLSKRWPRGEPWPPCNDGIHASGPGQGYLCPYFAAATEGRAGESGLIGWSRRSDINRLNSTLSASWRAASWRKRSTVFEGS